MKYSYLYILSIFVLTTTAKAQAQESIINHNTGTGYIGVSGLINSEYLGSSDQDTQVLPYLSFENVKGFDLFGTALTYRAIEAGTGEGLDKWSVRTGPSLAYQQGRDSEDSQNLVGFEDIDASFPLGGYIRSTIGPVGLRLDIGKDIAGGHDGVTANASIGTFYRIGNFAIQPAATISWADNTHNDSFFSVNSAQASTSGLDIFDASSGIYSYSLGAVSWVEIKDKYAIALIGSYSWFTNDALDSPIINASDGSENGFFVSLSLTQKFDTNKW